MKIVFGVLITVLSFSACSKEEAKNEKAKPSAVQSSKSTELTKVVPCESKEDLLKKLEEKKKMEEEKGVLNESKMHKSFRRRLTTSDLSQTLGENCVARKDSRIRFEFLIHKERLDVQV